MANSYPVIDQAKAGTPAVVVPAPRCPISVRAGAASDAAFIESLQRVHSHMVGWMPTRQIEGKLAAGHVLIAHDQHGTPFGYCVSQDTYAGRDDVGIVYQLNVLPLKQRHLIGATLIKSVFDRAAYGCRLFSCWCAQDIQANYFWESIGFIPLAFRTGSRDKQRIHIFWQRRIRANDDATPYWFPSQTKSGAIREDRLVLPIPPGTHWRDAKPVVLPGITVQEKTPDLLPGGAKVRPRPEQPKMSYAHRIAVIRSKSKHLKGLPPGKAAIIISGGFRYVDRADYVPEPEPAKPPRPKKPRQVNNPEHVRAARELRDKYLEQFNTLRALPGDAGKYDISRALPDQSAASTPIKVTALPAPRAA